MMLGKRHRQSMRRTTSLTELSSDHLPFLEPDSQTPDTHSPMQVVMEPPAPAQRPAGGSVTEGNRPHMQQAKQQPKEKGPRRNHPSEDWLVLGLLPPAAPSRVSRRNSGDFSGMEPAHFLRACGLCRRRLGPGRDTYMYRGEIAFCSLECRQQQMALDERKEKCSLTSMAANSSIAAQATAAAGPKTSAATAAAAAAAAAGGTAAAA